jgi:hypothetical protein
MDAGSNHSPEEVIMIPLKNPFNDDESIRRLELTLLRAFVVFHMAQKLLTVTIAEVHDAGRAMGWW